MKKLLNLLLLIFFSLEFSFAEKIIFSANSMTGKTGDSSSQTSLSGNAYIKTDSMEIMADSLELSGEDYRTIKAAGNITGKNLETNMEFSCDSLDYDRTTKIAVLRGNVDLNDIENSVKAKAQLIIYDQNAETAILQVGVTLSQKNNVCSGSYALYYKKDQILEISGNAQVKQGNDTFRAQFITLNMQTQDITLGGNVKGSVTESKSSENNAKEVPASENSGATVETEGDLTEQSQNSEENVTNNLDIEKETENE